MSFIINYKISSVMRKIKSYSTVALTVFALTFAFPGHTKSNKKTLSYGETVALSTANLIGRHKTVGEFIRVFKPHMKAGEYRNFKKALASKNIAMSDKIPKVKAKGNKIYIASGGGVIEIKNETTFAINGHKFEGSKKDITSRFESVYANLSKTKKEKKKISLMSFVVPEAHAFGNLMGIVSIFGAGLGGYYLGPKLGVKNSTGALLGVGGIYLATELWQSFKNGQITCTRDGQYQRRSKERNMWFMAMSEQTIISSDKIAEAGLGETCTRANAEALKAWSEQDRLQTPAPAPSTAAPSSAIYGE